MSTSEVYSIAGITATEYYSCILNGIPVSSTTEIVKCLLMLTLSTLVVHDRECEAGCVDPENVSTVVTRMMPLASIVSL